MFLWLIVSASVVGICVIFYLVEWLTDNKQPQTPIEVRVVKILDSGWFIRVGQTYCFNISGTGTVIFELISNRKRKNVLIPLDEIKKLSEGNIGVLTLQGSRFINFKQLDT